MSGDVVGRLRAAGCVYAEDEATLLLAAASTPRELEDLVVRRISGLPLEHVLGWAEFAGLRIAVDQGVFVPRRRSDLLVRTAADLVRPGAVVTDVCCGSGAVGAALLAARTDITVHACDIDAAAVACARRNLPPESVHLGDLLDALPSWLRGQLDLVVANAPYVPTGEIAMMPPEARDHEPRVALDGGTDGVEVHRRLAAAAPQWLAPDGALLIETGERQAATTEQVLVAAGFRCRTVRDEELDATVVLGVLTG